MPTFLHSHTRSWLYSKIAYVPQKPIIFDESIFYNLCYGWDAADARGEISPENFDLVSHPRAPCE
jgi:ABC-type multidrug transport system fused ATPase/permease subunit